MVVTPVEQQCLHRILAGLLRLRDGAVLYWHRGRRRWYVKRPTFNRGRARYHFKINGHVSCVYANRLVWMLVHRRAIPEGHYVDHLDLDRTNDAPDNLRLMPIATSRRQGNGCQADAKLLRLRQWFIFVGHYGREPRSQGELACIEEDF